MTTLTPTTPASSLQVWLITLVYTAVVVVSAVVPFVLVLAVVLFG